MMFKLTFRQNYKIYFLSSSHSTPSYLKRATTFSNLFKINLSVGFLIVPKLQKKLLKFTDLGFQTHISSTLPAPILLWRSSPTDSQLRLTNTSFFTLHRNPDKSRMPKSAKNFDIIRYSFFLKLLGRLLPSRFQSPALYLLRIF